MSTQHSAACRRLARLLCSCLAVIELVQGIVLPQWGGRSSNRVAAAGGPAASSPPATTPADMVLHQKKTIASSTPSRPLAVVSIRKTSREDLPKVAAYLATASLSQQQQGGNNILGFRARIDQMFAQDDIQKLLESRYLAMYEGQRSWKRLAQQVVVMEHNRKNNNNDDEEKSSMQLWRHWWTTSDRARATIASAVAMTAEPTLFDHGSTIALTPQPYALQHVQLTAVPRRRRGKLDNDDDDMKHAKSNTNNNNNNNNMPIGFCEVAMEPPLGRPLVLNVAVDPRHRRRGVARRLLRTAERYVRRHWKNGRQVVDPGIGLYVDPTNTAAMELYKSLGYVVVVVDSNAAEDNDAEVFVGPQDRPCDQNGARSLTYMFKAFSAANNKTTTGANQQWAEHNDNSIFTAR